MSFLRRTIRSYIAGVLGPESVDGRLAVAVVNQQLVKRGSK